MLKGQQAGSGRMDYANWSSLKPSRTKRSSKSVIKPIAFQLAKVACLCT